MWSRISPIEWLPRNLAERVFVTRSTTKFLHHFGSHGPVCARFSSVRCVTQRRHTIKNQTHSTKEMHNHQNWIMRSVARDGTNTDSSHMLRFSTLSATEADACLIILDSLGGDSWLIHVPLPDPRPDSWRDSMLIHALRMWMILRFALMCSEPPMCSLSISSLSPCSSPVLQSVSVSFSTSSVGTAKVHSIFMDSEESRVLHTALNGVPL